MCVIGEPSLKVLRLVGGDKPAVGYLYEAMEAIHQYYEDKGEEGFTK